MYAMQMLCRQSWMCMLVINPISQEAEAESDFKINLGYIDSQANLSMQNTIAKSL